MSFKPLFSADAFTEYLRAKTLWHYTSGSSAVRKARYSGSAGNFDAQGHKQAD
jgi:hypothetical protein